MATSKIYNLTDVSTPTLVQYGLVSQHIVIGDRVVAPGEFVEQPYSASLMVTLEHLLTVGAVSVDSLPPPYHRARAQAEAASGAKPSNAPAHLDVQETKVTDPGPQQPVEAPAAEVAPAEAVSAPAAEEPKATSRRR